ncbi:hypothetical protein HZH68_002237 [Vespula germanica]|uniref:Uncharacterized protein n=1 Tax=Vespula germanica TaxID=30212 RepID=A0A834NM55_VESGE|nr:hypothetical protein HZH68_002237 [Vespula germanica]
MEATVAVAVPVATCAANYLIPINDLVSVGPSSTRTHIGKEKEEFQVGGRERWMKREGPLFGASFRSRPKSVVEPYGMAHDERLRGFLILLGEHASRYYLECIAIVAAAAATAAAASAAAAAGTAAGTATGATAAAVDVASNTTM